MKIALVTDSTAYFTQEEELRWHFNVVPLTITFGDESFPEGTKYSNKQFYEKLSHSQEFPTTSQPPVGLFVETYTELLKNNEEIISIHLSGGMSGTVRAAQTAAEIVDKQHIKVIDSLSAAQGLAAMVIEGCKMAEEGKNVSEIVAKVKRMTQKSPVFFLVDTLDYLHRGGRIGGAAALFGNLLQIKPILYFDKKGGIDLFDKVRTEKRAEKEIVDVAVNKIKKLDSKNLRVVIAHANCLEKAVRLQKLFYECLPEQTTTVDDIGPVIGMHGGPGTRGIIISALD